MYIVRLVLFCADVFNDYLHKNCPYIAGAIALYTLFSVFPLILAIISVAGFFLGNELDRAQLASDIAEVIPVSNELISETIEGIVRTRTITSVFSVLGLLWAATAAFAAIRKGINNAWGITKTRPFLKERIIDLSLVCGAGVLVMMALFTAPTLNAARDLIGTVAPDLRLAGDFFWGMTTGLTMPLFSFATFLILYRYLPNTELQVRQVWPCALAASVCFDLATWGFVWYISKIAVYNAVYGSIGAVLVLLTWVYVSAIIMLFGALVASRYAAVAQNDKSVQALRIVWNGLSRVRLRVVAEPSLAVQV